MFTSIKKIYKNSEKLSREGIRLTVFGWVKSVRNQGKRIFVMINDGSVLENLQLVFDEENAGWEKIKKMNYAGSLIINGRLFLTPLKEQTCELKEINIISFQPVSQSYPLQKKEIPFSTLRDNLHLRSKTWLFSALFKIRHYAFRFVHDFFYQQGFYNVQAPIITNNDTEGTGEQFTLKTENEPFFNDNLGKLTVSAQLHLEAMVQGLGKVYSFGPCFRAEKSHTTRHLAEFWMVEIEIVCLKLVDLTSLAEKFIKFVLRKVTSNCFSELNHLNSDNIIRIKKVVKEKWLRITYSQAIVILQKNIADFFEKPKWGMNIQAEHEKFLCRYFDDNPVFVTDYPISTKAFYMSHNPDKKTVSCFDLLFPKLGELVGGGIRSKDYEILSKKTESLNNLEWYSNLRKDGYLKTGGFGLGFERLLMFISGIENIKDTIPFPITCGKLIY